MVYPMFAMVLLTYAVGIIVLVGRVKAVRTKQISVKYFKVFKGTEVPDTIVAGTNHFSNLFETPILFYIVSLLILVFNMETSLLIGLGWAYVVARIGHAYVHMTYNHILHRMLIFWLSILIILLMWILFVIEYSKLH